MFETQRFTTETRGEIGEDEKKMIEKIWSKVRIGDSYVDKQFLAAVENMLRRTSTACEQIERATQSVCHLLLWIMLGIGVTAVGAWVAVAALRGGL